MTAGFWTKVFASQVALSFVVAASPAHAADKEVKFERKRSVYDKLPEAKKGGIFYTSARGNPKVLNPILSDDNNSTLMLPYIFATLLTEDPDTLDPLPYLAESYTISPDNKTYTFILNKDAKWQDGTPVTADDVQFSFETMMNPKTDAAPARSYFEGVSFQPVDKLSFKFTVAEPKFDTLRQLYLFAPVQKAQFAAESDFNKSKGILNPVANGPFNLKSFSRDQSVTFERNKTWWGSALPHMKNIFNSDGVVIRIIADDTLNYEKFLKGDIDVTTFNQEQFATKVRGVDKDKVAESAKEGKRIWATEIENKAPRGFQYIGWNLRKPIFNDVKTRTALAHLVDYQQIIDKVYYGYVFQSTSPFGSLTFNSDKDLRKSGRMLTTNLKKGLELLKEAGWKDSDKDNILDKEIDGKPVPFRFVLRYNSNNPLRAKIAQIVKENFKAAGIDVDVRAMEWNAYLDDVDNRNFDAILLAWTGVSFPNPKQVWHSNSQKEKGSNAVGYSNPKVDELIEKANVEFDPKKRSEILKEINRLIYKDQPYTFLTEPRSLLAGFNSKVKAPSWAFQYSVEPAWEVYTYAK